MYTWEIVSHCASQEYKYGQNILFEKVFGTSYEAYPIDIFSGMNQ